ncbi:uncharacterized protein LOC114366441 [Ostrinia furnacalis]|uniref:uncharacterized protein LOC114366441 n=1 Tax=Ostrinia furnacalis TaxID=93504 RepID=UPI00103B4A14|nr:uncharacterized protein LOC114366441 [Ostrinia furnacalis]
MQEDGKIADMVPLDYQIINHGSPLIDLLYFCFGATDREFRKKYLEHLKDLYFSTMEQFLKYFEMDIQKYYPREEFEDLFKKRLDFGLFTCVWYLQFNLAEDDEIVMYQRCNFPKSVLEIRIKEFKSDYKKWLKNLLNGYI